MALEYKNRRSFPLRLSPFMCEQAGILAQREGISLHAFIVFAVLEKLSGVYSIRDRKEYAPVCELLNVDGMQNAPPPVRRGTT